MSANPIKNKPSTPAGNPAGESKALDVRAKSAAGEPATAENVGTIREILFGTQMRDYDQRFAQLEERLNMEAAQLRNEITDRLVALEAKFNQDLATEKADRLNGEKRLHEAITQLSAQLTATMDKKFQELRDAKLDRVSLAEMLTDVARQLRGRSA